MSNKGSMGWYFIAIVRHEGRDVHIVKLDADAVFAESGPEAVRLAASRNPLRPGQQFATTKVNNRREKLKAIRIAEERTSEIAQLQEILDFRCGLRDCS
jgi:hypothetical protein